MTIETQLPDQDLQRRRDAARQRIVAKRDLAKHLVVYVVVNGFVVLMWLFTGGGYFWPGWLMAAWGMGLVLQAWDLLWRRPISDEDIDAEMRRQR